LKRFFKHENNEVLGMKIFFKKKWYVNYNWIYEICEVLFFGKYESRSNIMFKIETNNFNLIIEDY
jgi:hypothetical protein